MLNLIETFENDPSLKVAYFMSPICHTLMTESDEIETLNQVMFMLKTIKIGPSMKAPEKAKLIFRASRDSWRPEVFHHFCDDKGPTLTLFRSSRGYLSAGFTSASWKNDPLAPTPFKFD